MATWHGQTKTFGGRKFRVASRMGTKAQAQKRADYFRKQYGKPARVTKEKTQYGTEYYTWVPK